MASRRSLEEKIRHLAELTADDADEVRAALAGANNALAAAGARAAVRCGADALVPELVEAFGRFMDGRPADKGCLAKTAIAEALNRLRYGLPDVFLRGIECVQWEPVYGGRADAAAELRCVCAEGLVRLGHPDLMRLLTGLLFDTEPGPRRAAVKAMRLLGGPEGELLLRAKALAGDADPEVMGDCFLALMELAPAASLRFVGRFIDGPDPVVAEEAALAVGESRTPAALELLMERWRATVDAGLKDALLLPIALTRGDEALEFLLEIVENGPTERAAAAVEALKTFDDAGDRRRRIHQAVEGRDEPLVTRAYHGAFDR